VIEPHACRECKELFDAESMTVKHELFSMFANGNNTPEIRNAARRWANERYAEDHRDHCRSWVA
jgi:hypothetical protein